MTVPVTPLFDASAPEIGRELDDVTLGRATAGDRSACRELVLLYQERVFALLSRTLVGADGSTVEDIAQDAFLDVFRRLAHFDPRGTARLSTWILTIASRRAVDHLRRRRPPKVTATPDELPSPLRADDQATRRDIARAIREALLELSPQHRAAFILREYHGFTYEEIATALDVKAGTVKSRLSRAREQLRARLEELK